MKIWAKTRLNGEYHSHNIAHAVFGFRELGAEIVKYQTIDEIYNKVKSNDIVLDYIDQCNTIFDKFNVIPNLPDYPECMQEFLNRRIWKDTIDSIAFNEAKWKAGNFVKPVKNKAFTGKIIRSISDLIGCGSHSENYEVYVSEPINIKAEWRCFIYYDNIIDIRPYSKLTLTNEDTSWKHNYNVKTVESMIKKFKTWNKRPAACSMDIAVIETDIGEKTVLIEFNDAYALGNYGLHHIAYAKLISARWSQLLNREDQFKFG